MRYMNENDKQFTQKDLNMALETGKRIGKGEGHNVSAPETRERLAKLETNQNNLMQEIQEIKQMIKDLGNKLDCALEKKADKAEVEVMKKDLTDLRGWMWKTIGVATTLLFLASFFREQILSLFK